jgi:RNA polymerase sigma-70 factor (ECF subfamily)
MARHVPFNKQDLEDLHNTVFLRLFEQDCRKLRQYQGKNGCSLASWIRMIAVRTVLDHLRKKGVDAMVWQKKCLPLEDLPELEADEAEPGVEMEKAEKERVLREGMQSLPPRYRLFMKLHLEQGLPVSEVAEAMRLSVGNAYTLKHRAVEKLKSYVASVGNNDP